MAELAYALLLILVRSIRNTGGSKDRRQCVNSHARISNGGSRKDPLKGDVRVLVKNRKSYSTRIRRGKAKRLVDSNVIYCVNVLLKDLYHSRHPHENVSALLMLAEVLSVLVMWQGK